MSHQVELNIVLEGNINNLKFIQISPCVQKGVLGKMYTLVELNIVLEGNINIKIYTNIAMCAMLGKMYTTGSIPFNMWTLW